MKKSLSFFLVALIGCFSTSDVIAQGLGFGIKAGVNISSQNVSGDDFSDPDDVESLIGFHGGVFLTYMFTENLGIQPELLYSMQGSTVNFGSVDYQNDLDYITIPILFRFNINEMFSLHAGPQFGFLMSANVEDNLGNSEDAMDFFKGTDMSIAIGAEADLPMKLGVGLRYVAGLTDIAEEGESWDGYSIKNGVFQLYLKYRLKGGDKK